MAALTEPDFVDGIYFLEEALVPVLVIPVRSLRVKRDSDSDPEYNGDVFIVLASHTAVVKFVKNSFQNYSQIPSY